MDGFDKSAVDRRVAFDLGMNRRIVSLVTEVFLHRCKLALAKNDQLVLQGFGRFNVHRYSGPGPSMKCGTDDVYIPKLEVRFAKAKAFRRCLRKHGFLDGTNNEGVTSNLEVDHVSGKSWSGRGK